MLEAMDAEVLDKVVERYGKLVSKTITPDKSVKFQSRPIEDKTGRSTFHQNIRKIFQGSVLMDTFILPLKSFLTTILIRVKA